MADYIPRSDADFNNWIKTYCEYVNTNFAALGLSVVQNTNLQALLTSWDADYPAHLTAQATAKSFAQKKDATRVLLGTLVRELTRLIQANSTVTNEQKAALQITIPKTTKTPTPVPSTKPMAEVDNRNRLEQIIHFFDESTPGSRAKPAGVRGCELWLKIGGAAPLGPTEVTYVATDTKTPYIYHFLGTDAGKTAHWMLRWVNTKNEAGPWSETISVTISA